MTALKNSKADVINNRIDQVDKPFQPGTFTNATRDNDIPNPTQGMIIFNSEEGPEGELQVFIGTGWSKIEVSAP